MSSVFWVSDWAKWMGRNRTLSSSTVLSNYLDAYWSFLSAFSGCQGSGGSLGQVRAGLSDQIGKQLRDVGIGCATFFRGKVYCNSDQIHLSSTLTVRTASGQRDVGVDVGTRCYLEMPYPWNRNLELENSLTTRAALTDVPWTSMPPYFLVEIADCDITPSHGSRRACGRSALQTARINPGSMSNSAWRASARCYCTHTNQSARNGRLDDKCHLSLHQTAHCI